MFKSGTLKSHFIQAVTVLMITAVDQPLIKLLSQKIIIRRDNERS
tara:strand:+ start:169 stop:303 length:135 start_codon:yes stop_codon:yes gene_type:complete